MVHPPKTGHSAIALATQGSDSGSFRTGCVNTISKEMGPFSASSEWNEWINFHSKWVSYQLVHSLWVHFALPFHSIWAIFPPFNMGNLQHKYSLTTMWWELCFALSEHISRPPLPHRSHHELTFVVRSWHFLLEWVFTASFYKVGRLNLSHMVFEIHLQYGYTLEAIHSFWVHILGDPFNLGIILKY